MQLAADLLPASTEAEFDEPVQPHDLIAFFAELVRVVHAKGKKATIIRHVGGRSMVEVGRTKAAGTHCDVLRLRPPTA